MSGPAFDPAFREQLIELFRWRRDVRHFQTTPIPEPTVERLLAIARLAPSVGLSEPWRLVRVRSQPCREAIRSEFVRCNEAALSAHEGADADHYASLKLAGLDHAPCQLAVFAEPDPVQGRGLGRRTMPETTDYSAVLALHTLWLAARAEGIGLGWISILDPAGIGTILAVPPSWHFIGYVCLGWPDTEHETPELERLGWERRSATDEVIER